MTKEMLLMIDENGEAKLYDDTYDIVIHCESEEERDKAINFLTKLDTRTGELLNKENYVEVIRCRDCKKSCKAPDWKWRVNFNRPLYDCTKFDKQVKGDEFCSWAERENDG